MCHRHNKASCVQLLHPTLLQQPGSVKTPCGLLHICICILESKPASCMTEELISQSVSQIVMQLSDLQNFLHHVSVIVANVTGVEFNMVIAGDQCQLHFQHSAG